MAAETRKQIRRAVKPLRGTELKRFLRDYRKAHPLKHHIVFLLQSVSYPVNVGSIFRIADACHIEEVILTGITPTPPHPTLSKVARGKERRVPWSYAKTAEEVIPLLKEKGYIIYALEITERAIPYHRCEYPPQVCLVVGNEDHGITRQTLNLCHQTLFVPMYGKGRALNVHVCLGIVCYHILHQNEP